MNPLYFWKKYELAASTKTFNSLITIPRVCRFCLEDETATTFNTTAHVVPELLGENDFTSLDECDKCNSKFSGFESHLSIFFRPYLTMVGVKGKRKIPEFHSRTENGNESTRTIVKVAEDEKRNLILSDLADYKIDEKGKRMSITFRKPPHKPLWVYKALVKIALSLLPKERISKYKNVFDWLLNKPDCYADYFVTAFITVLTRGKFQIPFAELYTAKRTVYKKHFLPELTLVLGFGNLIVQIFLPLSQEFENEMTEGKTPILNLFPSFAFDKDLSKEKFTINAVDLKGEISITYDETLHFVYDFAELNLNKQNAPD